MIFQWTILASLAAASVADADNADFLQRRKPTDLRIVSYNINWDSIFPEKDPRNHNFRSTNQTEAFRRVIAALNPDIMCLQEINSSREPREVADIFDEAVPLGGQKQWRAAIGYSNVIVSRYPLDMIRSTTVPAGQRAQCMALIDLPNARFFRDIYIMNEHFKCCGGERNDDKRQKQADSLVNWMRDIRDFGGYIDLPTYTPIVVAGDFNIVGGPGPRETVICGGINDEKSYGADSPPDWDGTCNTDLHPRHNAIGTEDYTWRDDTTQYAPGRLDYMIYTDSVMIAVHSFILNTTVMTQGALDAAGLTQFDVLLQPPGQFDHLPLVADFRLIDPRVADGDVNRDGLTDGNDIDPFADLIVAGPSGDSNGIARADYNKNGTVDLGDITGFVADLLAP